MENREANQAAFEKVVRHLLRQGKRSSSDGWCQYRGPLGLKCAIGVLIPDEEYVPAMDGLTASALRLMREFAPPSLLGLDECLLTELQEVHDHAEPDAWADKLATVADSFGLAMPDLESQA